MIPQEVSISGYENSGSYLVKCWIRYEDHPLWPVLLISQDILQNVCGGYWQTDSSNCCVRTDHVQARSQKRALIVYHFILYFSPKKSNDEFVFYTPSINVSIHHKIFKNQKKYHLKLTYYSICKVNSYKVIFLRTKAESILQYFTRTLLVLDENNYI